MELETASRRHLLALPAVAGYVQDRGYKFSLGRRVDGTGGLAFVVRRSNQWSAPDPVQSSEYPLLAFDAWADPSRGPDGEKIADDAPDKAYALTRVVQKFLHGVRDVRWGAGGTNPGLYIVSCSRWSEPMLVTADDTHGGSDGDNNQPIALEAKVTTLYAVHLVH